MKSFHLLWLPLVVLAGCNSAPFYDPNANPGSAPSSAPSGMPALLPPIAPSAPVKVAVTPAPIAAAIKTFQGTDFLFTYPTTWSVKLSAVANEVIQVANGVGSFTVQSVPDRQYPTLALAQASVVQLAGDGLVQNTGYTLDNATGFQVIGDDRTPAGPRFVNRYGFIYRHTFYTITTSWNKLTSDAATMQKDTAAMLAAWRWI